MGIIIYDSEKHAQEHARGWIFANLEDTKQTGKFRNIIFNICKYALDFSLIVSRL